jgi:two-component system cell cycle sensor histidine kinase/response regulator CckA
VKSTVSVPAPHFPGEQKTLLLVDDEAGVRELLRAVLQKAGYRCFAASDGGEALKLFRHFGSSIAGIISDVKMPVVDGFAVVKQVREIAPEAKIVLSSGSLPDAEQRIVADLGVSDFLQKPYTAQQLLACARDAFGGPG